MAQDAHRPGTPGRAILKPGRETSIVLLLLSSIVNELNVIFLLSIIIIIIFILQVNT